MDPSKQLACDVTPPRANIALGLNVRASNEQRRHFGVVPTSGDGRRRARRCLHRLARDWSHLIHGVARSEAHFSSLHRVHAERYSDLRSSRSDDCNAPGGVRPFFRDRECGRDPWRVVTLHYSGDVQRLLVVAIRNFACMDLHADSPDKATGWVSCCPLEAISVQSRSWNERGFLSYIQHRGPMVPGAQKLPQWTI